MAMNREVHQEPFYHADPHPANLVVMPNNRICFIDFGAIGTIQLEIERRPLHDRERLAAAEPKLGIEAERAVVVGGLNQTDAGQPLIGGPGEHGHRVGRAG